MKKFTTIVPGILGLLLTQMAPAQGTLQVSNLGQTPTASAAIGSDSWIAQTFFLGALDPTVYKLDAVQLLMNPASGNPAGGFSVSIYDNPSLGSLTPLNFLGSLTGPDPSAGGVFTYTTSGITIKAGPAYFVVVTAATPVERGSYNWSAHQGFPTSSGTWTIDDSYASSTNGSTWTGHTRQNVFQMALYTTPTPEPGTLALAGFGLACLSFCRRRQ